jgi:hypothetical protein
MTDHQADLREAIDELLAELRRLRRGGLVARLSGAEREEIADRVFERVDERLAPAEAGAASDDEPPGRGSGSRRYFGR